MAHTPRFLIEEQQKDGRWFIHGERDHFLDAHNDMIDLRRLFPHAPLRIWDASDPNHRTIVAADTLDLGGR